MLGLLLEEFPCSKTVLTAKKLISTGIIGDNTAHARVYDVSKDSITINGSTVEFISDKDLAKNDILDKIVSDLNASNENNSDDPNEPQNSFLDTIEENNSESDFDNKSNDDSECNTGGVERDVECPPGLWLRFR